MRIHITLSFIGFVMSNDLFLIHVNMFRNYPLEYKKYFNIIRTNCNDEQKIDVVYKSNSLMESSSFQSRTLSFNNCSVISHNTCPLYVAKFHNDPSYSARILSFFNDRDDIDIMGEVLVGGLSNMTKIIKAILNSKPHCEIVRSPYANIIGSSVEKNDKKIFVADIAYDNDFEKNIVYFYTACQRREDGSTEIFAMDLRSPPCLFITVNNATLLMSPIMGKKYFYLKTDLHLDRYKIHDCEYFC